MYDLFCFFAAATVTNRLPLDYHPEDPRRVRDVFDIFLSLYLVVLNDFINHKIQVDEMGYLIRDLL